MSYNIRVHFVLGAPARARIRSSHVLFCFWKGMYVKMSFEIEEDKE